MDSQVNPQAVGQDTLVDATHDGTFPQGVNFFIHESLLCPINAKSSSKNNCNRSRVQGSQFRVTLLD
jgi:hypothetical protein